MSSSDATYQLFTPSGCLSREGAKKTISNDLNEEEYCQVKLHLDACELCKDALEGLANLRDSQAVDKITEEVKKAFIERNEGVTSETTDIQKHRRDRIFYFSAAAIIVILVGLLFTFNNTLNQDYFKGDSAHEINIPEKNIPPKPPAFKNSQKQNARNEKLTEEKEAHSKGAEKEHSSLTPENDQKGNDPRTMGLEKIPGQLKSEKNGLDAFLQEENKKTITETSKLSNNFVDIASNQPIEYYLAEIIIENQDRASDLRLSGWNNESTNIHSIEQRNEYNGKEEMMSEEDNASLSFHFFNPVETMPEFPGGFEGLNAYLSRSLSYPPSAYHQKIQGRVIVSFMIDQDGSVKNVTVVKGLEKNCDEEAIRVIRTMPAWKPAFQNNQPVGVLFTLPIHFRIL